MRGLFAHGWDSTIASLTLFSIPTQFPPTNRLATLLVLDLLRFPGDRVRGVAGHDPAC